nr:ATP synthase F0 subunit 8 [Chelonus munakatae]
MPQMSPMNWFLLMFFNLFNYMFFLFYIYYIIYFNKVLLMNIKLNYVNFNLNW